MSELYWITTLGKINTVCWILFALSILILLIVIPCYFNYFDDFDEDDIKISIKSIKLTIISTIVCGLCGIILPGKNEACFIYGAGTIVDYCKDNPKVKEIPDKAIDALNRYLDSIAEDKKGQ